MFPLVADRASHPDYLLLDQVLDGALAEVSEVSDVGSVPELQFRNKADKDVLALAKAGSAVLPTSPAEPDELAAQQQIMADMDAMRALTGTDFDVRFLRT